MTGRSLLRLVVQSLLRAGIKSIPFAGSGIDQLTFGIKDAISNTEVRNLIEGILCELGELRHYIEAQDAEKMASTADALLERPEMQVIARRLEEANASALVAVATFLREMARHSQTPGAPEIDLREVSGSVESATSAIMQELKRSENPTELQYRRVQEQLHGIEHIVSQGGTFSRPPLEDVLAAVEGLDMRLVGFSAFAVRTAFDIGQVENLRLTVDFSEIYRYSMSPYSDDPAGAFAVYVFRSPHAPLYILPGTALELDGFLRRRFAIFADPARFHETLRARLSLWIGRERPNLGASDLAFLADATLNRRSPLQRLSSLINEGRVAPWSGPLPSKKDLANSVEVALNALSRVRPHAGSANAIDALNLATVALLNATGGSGHAPAIHVSGARTLEQIQEHVRKFMGGHLALDAIPLVVHPAAFAYASYLAQGDTKGSKERLVAAARTIERLPALTKSWIDTIRDLDFEVVGRMGSDLRSAAKALDVLHGAVSPFHRVLLESEVADLIGEVDVFGTTVWGAQFEEVHSRLVGTIAHLLSYVEPLATSMRPFLQLTGAIGSREGET